MARANLKAKKHPHRRSGLIVGSVLLALVFHFSLPRIAAPEFGTEPIRQWPDSLYSNETWRNQGAILVPLLLGRLPTKFTVLGRYSSKYSTSLLLTFPSHLQDQIVLSEQSIEEINLTANLQSDELNPTNIPATFQVNQLCLLEIDDVDKFVPCQVTVYLSEPLPPATYLLPIFHSAYEIDLVDLGAIVAREAVVGLEEEAF